MTDYKKLCEDLYDLSDSDGLVMWARQLIRDSAYVIEELQAIIQNERKEHSAEYKRLRSTYISKSDNDMEKTGRIIGSFMAERENLQAENQRLKKQLDAAVADMSVGWLCYCCKNRVRGDEWARCEKQVFKGGPEDTAMCANFKWRGEDGDTNG